MPSIVSFRRNVGHAVILIILFSIFLLGYPCLSIYPPTFRDHSQYRREVMEMWQWLQKNHPIAYEVIWCVVAAMGIASIVISIICIAGRG